MKQAKEIRNGSLYFNSLSDRVERALGKVNSMRVWTNYHENAASATRVKNLRKASTAEIAEYVSESEMLNSAAAPV